MSEPAATASIELARPLTAVRAQLFDLDHTMRARVHHGVTLRWLPPEAPGERRLEQEIKVLARVHADVFVIDDEGGAWVKRFVAGPNEGTRFVATFEAVGAGMTRVKLAAYTGPKGYHSGLGKLSQLGLEKALQKILEEHRRALVGYEPGRAQGAVGAVLAPLRDAVLDARNKVGGESPMRAVMTNLLEAACVVAIADGRVDDAEREVIQAVSRTLGFMEIDAAAVDEMVGKVFVAVDSEGIEARCEKIARRLDSFGLGEVGLTVAVLVAQVSHGIDAPELAVLSKLSGALEVGEARLADIIHGVDRRLGGAGE